MLDFFGISLGTEPWHAERIFFLKDPQAANSVAFSCLPGGPHGIADVNAVVRHTGADLRFVPIDFNPAYVEYASTNDKMAFLMDADTWGFQLYIKKLIVIENAK